MKRNRCEYNKDDEAQNHDMAFIEKESGGKWITCMKTRYTVLIMAALGSLNLYAVRNVLSIAIIVMVVNIPSNSTNNDSSGIEGEACFVEKQNLTADGGIRTEKTNSGNTTFNADGFDWSLKQQGALLSSALYAYIVSNILGGWMSKRIGIRITYAAAGLSSSVLTMLMPVAAKTSFLACLILRITIGFLQGPSLPTAMAVVGIWAPPTERSRFVAIIASGTGAGLFITFPFVGLIVSAYGWEASFYVVGVLGIIWSIAWFVLVHDSPATHPRISQKELAYIFQDTNCGKHKDSKTAKIPWIKMLTCRPFLATVAIHAAENWLTGFAALWIPIYFSRVLKYDIKAVGILASLPYICRVATQLITAFVVDFVLLKKWFRIVTVRKAITGSSFVAQIISLIVLCYLGCSKTSAVALFCLIIGLFGVSYSGYRASVVDIAPQFSGLLYSISNFVATCLYFSVSLFTGFILDSYAGSIAGWKVVFWSCTGFLLVGVIAYSLFASDQVQQWSIEGKDENKEDSSPDNKTRLISENDA